MKFRKLNNLVPISRHFRKPGGKQNGINLRKPGWPFVLSCVIFLVVGLLGMGEKPAV